MSKSLKQMAYDTIESHQETIADLRTQLAKANKRADYYMKLITSDIGYEHAKDLEKGILEEIENRDNREEWLDKLSVEIARYFGVDIGEHSSANNPWVEAFEAIPEDTLNKFVIEQKIEAVNKVLGSERFELENRPFDFGVRVESIEIILKNLEIELNSEQLRKEQDSE